MKPETFSFLDNKKDGTLRTLPDQMDQVLLFKQVMSQIVIFF